jgi:nucleotidyltransferase/DNA polymerase involved in DNA repair
VLAVVCEPEPLIQCAWHALPALRRAPLAIAGDDERVLAACPLAQARGIRPGHRVAQARFLCPAITIRAPDQAASAVLYEDLLDALATVSPIVEATDPAGDLVYLDGRGLERMWGAPPAVAGAALHAAIAAGVDARVGGGPSRLVAQALANRMRGDAGPSCLTGAEATAFLHALPLSEPGFALPVAVLDQLDELGLRTASALAALPRAGVALRFDAGVLALWDLLKGSAEPPLRAWARPEHLAARFQSDEGLEDRTVLEHVLHRLAGEIAAQLRAGSQATACLTLRLSWTDGAARIARASQWPALFAGDALARAVLPLLEHCLGEPSPQPVEALVLEATGLCPAPVTQAALFGDPLAPRRARLEDVLADQARRHGAALIGRWQADPLDRDGWRRDDWRP